MSGNNDNPTGPQELKIDFPPEVAGIGRAHV